MQDVEGQAECNSLAFLAGISVFQTCTPDASAVARAAVDFAAHLAADMGADVLVDPGFPSPSTNTFVSRGKRTLQGSESPPAPSSATRMIILRASSRQAPAMAPEFTGVNVVGDPLDSEATLFAESGLSELLGDPDREPLVPAGGWAAGSIGYAAFSALMTLVFALRRNADAEQATVDCLGLMSWINWKAAAGALLGQELKRQGAAAEWPLLPCKDGYFAFVYGEADWPNIVKMIDDPRLADPRYANFELRRQNREGYQDIVRSWMASRSKSELTDLFASYRVPGAAVAELADLLSDPLLTHREAFAVDATTHSRYSVLPHRVEARHPAKGEWPKEVDKAARSFDGLPLEGVRVLDLGIITAGAGTGALLADLGAEVLKIESEAYPDPFRKWAGSSESPLFKFNNRNKFGLSIDLKTDSGRQQFLKLVKDADVVVENFRRGVLERMGLGLDVLRAANPRIVLASVSGQGNSGPGAERSSYGSSLEASCGFAEMTRDENGQPFITGRNVNYPDQIVCLYACAIIIAAVDAATTDNSAIHVDIAQRDTAMHIVGALLEGASLEPHKSRAALIRGVGNVTYEGTVVCQDRRCLALAIRSWDTLENLPDKPVIRSLGDLRTWAGNRTALQAAEQCRAQGISAAVTALGSEMFASPVVKASRVFETDSSGALVKGFPFLLRGAELRIQRPAPSVGQHSDEYLPR